DAAIRPDTHVLAYATTWVRVERDQAAAIRAGSTGAIKVWSSGGNASAPVLDQPDYRPVRIDQDAAPVVLRAGWNRITVKLGAQEAGWAFFLRLTTPDGSPLAFTSQAAVPAEAAKPGRNAKPPRAPLAIGDLKADLRRAAESGAVEAERAYGLYLHY